MVTARRARKIALITLFAVCLAIYINYVTNIADTTSILAFTVMSGLGVFDKMHFLRSVWASNTEDEITDNGASVSSVVKAGLWDVLKHRQSGNVSHRYIDFLANITSAGIFQDNNSSSNFNSEEIYQSTTMTFNKSLVVYCESSPYVYCVPPDLKIQPRNVVKIGYLEPPDWFNQDLCGTRCCHPGPCAVRDKRITPDTQVILVYGVGLSDFIRPPPVWHNKTYILALWEPPVHTYADFTLYGRSVWNYRINLIVSYRLDGDVFSPYNTLAFNPKPLHERPNYYEIAKAKTRTAVWIASHCKTHSLRERYVKEMQKYIDVDKFGDCGKPCSYNNRLCYNWPAKYKFYLSFENSLCMDYVTEKFFKIFDNNIPVIPVVRGGADYDTHFPSFTYINSAHFKTPKDLALHLKHLAADLDTYSKYLEYKDLYSLVGTSMPGCAFCSFLTSHTFPKLKIYNLTTWIANGRCYRPRDL